MRAVSVNTNIRIGTKRKIKIDLRAIISGSKIGCSYDLISRYDIVESKTREKTKRIIFVKKFRLKFSDCKVILDFFEIIIIYAFSILLP